MIVSRPRLVEGMPKVVRLFAGRVAYAVDADGRLWSWGRPGRPFPAIVPGLDSVVDVVATNPRTSVTDVFALLSDGTVWGWGDGTYGLLGTGNGEASTTPVQIEELQDTQQIAIGLTTAFALDKHGVVRSWGYGLNGQLGDGTETWFRSTPEVVPGLPTARRVYSAGDTQFVLDAEGGVWSWGRNLSGSLGNGTSSDSSAPVAVEAITAASRLFVSGFDSGAFAVVPR